MAPRPIETWTLASLIGAFIDLALASLFLCAASLAFAADNFLAFFGHSLPIPRDGLFGRPQTLLLDSPTAKIASVHSSLRSRFPFDPIFSSARRSDVRLITDGDAVDDDDEDDSVKQNLSLQHSSSLPLLLTDGFAPEDAGWADGARRHSVGNDGIEGAMLRDLERALLEEQAARAAVYADLEKERSAAASAADEAMAMILRLQEEKAAVEIEARQFRRMVEEKSAYDEEEMGILKEIVMRREIEKHFLEKELEGYRQQQQKQKQMRADEDDVKLMSASNLLEDPVLMLQQIYDSLEENAAKGIKMEGSWFSSGKQVCAAAGSGDAVGDDGIKQAQSFEKYHLDMIDSGCETEVEEKGIIGTSYAENSFMYGKSEGPGFHKASSILLSKEDGARDAGQKVGDFSQVETESRVLDVYVIDDRLNLGDRGNNKEVNDIYGEVDRTIESSGTNTSDPVPGFGSVEPNISRSHSDMTSGHQLGDNLCHKSSNFGPRRSSMSAIDNERSKLEVEVDPSSSSSMAIAGGRQKAASLLPHLVKTLRRESPNPSNQTLPSLRRTFSLYDQINLIDTVPDDQLRFQGYSDTGFTVNGVKHEGSLLVIENKLMSWAPKRFSEITAESLTVFKIVRPVPEILILGCGRNIEFLDPDLRLFIRSTGMKLEVLDSRNGASTYNILNEEGRMVAAALLPYGVTS